MNRGEAQKVLSIKVIIPDFIFNKLKSFCYNKWIKPYRYNEKRKLLIENAVLDSYTRLSKFLFMSLNKRRFSILKRVTFCFSTTINYTRITCRIEIECRKSIYRRFRTKLKATLVNATSERPINIRYRSWFY